MTERLKRLCDLLSYAPLFADVGCDHGYCAEYMLKNGLCERAYITDISRDCLAKAEKLLSEYIGKGVCNSVCCDGLQGVPKEVNLVLIAGMGGMEMVHILAEGLPERFVLQPMRDSAAVRKLLLEKGASIERDFTFFAEGKFYDVIKGKKEGGARAYTQTEIDFGRENILLRSEDFLRSLQEKIQKQENILSRPLNEEARKAAEEKLQYLKEVLCGEIT
jgi:tRNA (adenine22-N1)-methyltransferase